MARHRKGSHSATPEEAMRNWETNTAAGVGKYRSKHSPDVGWLQSWPRQILGRASCRRSG